MKSNFLGFGGLQMMGTAVDGSTKRNSRGRLRFVNRRPFAILVGVTLSAATNCSLRILSSATALGEKPAWLGIGIRAARGAAFPPRRAPKGVFNMFRFLAVAAVFSTVLAAEASGAVLTCTTFRTRIAEALRQQTGRKETSILFAPASGGSAMRRSDWSTGDGLSGKLTCGADDALADFYMTSSAPDGRDAVTPFEDLAAASVCAFSAGVTTACRALATTMTRDGIDQYRTDIAEHDDHPQGLQNYDVVEDVSAAFYVTPAAMSWAIGPGLFNSVQAVRLPLAPADHDED